MYFNPILGRAYKIKNNFSLKMLIEKVTTQVLDYR